MRKFQGLQCQVNVSDSREYFWWKVLLYFSLLIVNCHVLCSFDKVWIRWATFPNTSNRNNLKEMSANMEYCDPYNFFFLLEVKKWINSTLIFTILTRSKCNWSVLSNCSDIDQFTILTNTKLWLVEIWSCDCISTNHSPVFTLTLNCDWWSYDLVTVSQPISVQYLHWSTAGKFLELFYQL